MTQATTAVAEQPRSPMVEGFARFWADPNPAVLPAFLAEDVVGHFPGEPAPVRGRDTYVAWMARLLELLPDLRLEVADHATNGESHFIRWIARATGAKGPFEFSGIDRIRVRDGLVAENVVVFDTALFDRLVGIQRIAEQSTERRRFLMTDVMTKDVTTTVGAYFAMWNEEDTARRAQHIKEAWADNGRYVDPARDAEGHAALNEMVSAARGQYPGFALRRSSEVDAHNDRIRFAWRAVAPDGSVPLAGIDFGILASDGRLQSITGFIGELSQETAV